MSDTGITETPDAVGIVDEGVLPASARDFGSPVVSVVEEPIDDADCAQVEGMASILRPNGDCMLIDKVPVTRKDYFDNTPHLDGQFVLPIGDGPCVGEEWADFPRFLEQEGHSLCRLPLEPWGQPNMNWPPETDEENLPMVCVTWCDAWAYCDHIGKRLCGNERVSTLKDVEQIVHVGEDPLALVNHHQFDEWYLACTAGMERTYSYSANQRVESCHSVESPCEGPYEGMVMGTLEGEYRAPASTFVWTRGGCRAEEYQPISPPGNFDDSVGFRCCAR